MTLERSKRWRKTAKRVRDAKHRAVCANVLYLIDRCVCIELHNCSRDVPGAILNTSADAAKALQAKFDTKVRELSAGAIRRCRSQVKDVKAASKQLRAENKRLQAENRQLRDAMPTQMDLIPPDARPLAEAVYALVYAMHSYVPANEMDRLGIVTAYWQARESLAEIMKVDPERVWLPTVMNAYQRLSQMIEMLGKK